MEIDKKLIKELRSKTGAGIMDCREALQECQGDLEKATEFLRKKGLEALKKKSFRAAKEGLIDSYIHGGGRIGVLIEVNCETDFVARNKDFKQFVHDLAMQVAAADPLYVSRDQVPSELIKKEKELYREQASDKPPQVIDRIVEGKLEKFFESSCLLEQPFIKNPEIKVQDYLGEVAAKLGENIVIRRFVRYVLGDATS
jgi:elongation factor Ts